MDYSSVLVLGLVGLVIILGFVLTRTYYYVGRERDRAAALTNTLLLRLAKEAPTAFVSDVSQHSDGPAMRKLELRTPGFHYTYLTPHNWAMGDPEVPRPLRLIEGTVTDVGDISMRQALLSHPLWERSDVSSFAFLLGADPHEDPELRSKHGILYDLVAKNAAGNVVFRAEGVINGERLLGREHHDCILRIAKAAEAHIAAQVDSEGGMP